MSPTRRALLKWLPAIAFVPPLPSFGSARGEGGPVNLVGFGGAGHRILRRLVKVHPAARELCRVDLAERREVGGAVTYDREPLGLLTEPPSGPSVVVAGLGYGPGGESSFEFAAAMGRRQQREVRGLLVLPFEFEGHRRERGVAQAARFVERFPDSLVIDNERFLGQAEEESLLDVYERVNTVASEILTQAISLK